MNKLIGMTLVIMVLTVAVSGCISQAPEIIDQEIDDGTEDHSQIDSQIGDLESLDDDVDDSDLQDLDTDLANVNW
jgi:hypothetical protein